MNLPKNLLPRFSLRWLMLAMTVFAVLSIIVSRAIQGNALALGFSLALFSGALLLSLFAVVFAVVSLIRKVVVPEGTGGLGSSPFGNAAVPQQVVVPPQDVD